MTGWYQQRWSREPWADALLKGAFYFVVWLVVGVAIVLGLAVWTRADPDPGVFRGAAVSLLFGWAVRLLSLLVRLLVQTVRAARSGLFLDELAGQSVRQASHPALADADSPETAGSPAPVLGEPAGVAPLVAQAATLQPKRHTALGQASDPASAPAPIPASPGEFPEALSGPFRGGVLDSRVAQLMTELDYPPSVAELGAVLNLGDPDHGEYAYRVTAASHGLEVLWVGERRALTDVGTFANIDAFQKWWVIDNASAVRRSRGVDPELATVDRWGYGAHAVGTEVTHTARSETLTIDGRPFAEFRYRHPRKNIHASGGVFEAVVLSNVASASLGEVIAAIESPEGGAFFSPGPYTWTMSDRRLTLPDPHLQVPNPRYSGAAQTAQELTATIESGLTSRSQALAFMAGFLGARVCREYINRPSLWDTIGPDRYLIVWLGEPRDRGWKWHEGTGADAVAETHGKGGLVIRHGSHSLVLRQEFVASYL